MWASVSSNSIRILSYWRVLLPRVSATPTSLRAGAGSPALVFMDNTNNSSNGTSSFASFARSRRYSYFLNEKEKLSFSICLAVEKIEKRTRVSVMLMGKFQLAKQRI